MPIDGSGLARMMGEKPLISAPRDQYVYRPTPRRSRSSPRRVSQNRPHSITASVEIPEGGAEGVLLCQGTASGGYSLYVKDGRLHYVHNYVARQVIQRCLAATGCHPARMSSGSSSSRRASPTCPMGGALPGRLQLYVDGKLVANAEAPVHDAVHAQPWRARLRSQSRDRR